MFAERLAVVADDDNDCFALIDCAEETSDLRIDIFDFAIVSLRIWLRRSVWSVRIVQMDPGEERPRIRPPKPPERPIDRLASSAFRLERRGGIVWIARDFVVVSLESAIQTETAIEHERADEGSGAVAGFRKERCQRLPLGKFSDTVVSQAVMQRQQARENRRVRRQRERRDAVRLFVPCSIPCEPQKIRGR